MKFYGKLSYHKYEGIALDEDECPRVWCRLGPTNKAMILVNHGLRLAEQRPRAFLRIYYLERSCQAQVAALSGGWKLIIPSEEVCRHAAAQHERPGRCAARIWTWSGKRPAAIERAPIDYRS